MERREPDRAIDEIPPAIEDAVEEIGEDYLEALRRGDKLGRKSIVDGRPDLAPWLDRRLRLIEWMHGLASSSESGWEEEPPPPRLRCPKCNGTILQAIPGPGDVNCEHCGSTFRVEGGAEGPWLTARFPKTIGKFRVTEVLGQGSFGIVYKAVDADLGRIVTLKVPRTGAFRSPEEAARFAREARSAAGLRHPGIVQVHEIAEEDGIPCIVREYIEGKTLEEILREERPSFRKGAAIVEQVADALDHAHREGIVHRDIKPENIIIDAEGRAHITDFGLARKDEGEVTITLDGQVLGTPAYMSPEQAAGEAGRVDGRSDIYSLGVILYELITGERPFAGTRNMVLLQVLRDEPRPPRRLNDRISRDLETICAAAMRKERDRRYATAGAFRDDLRRFLAGEPVRARPLGRAGTAWRWCRRNPAVASLTAAVAILLAAATVGSIAAALRFRDDERRATEYGRQASIALEESRRQLVRLHVASGTRMLEEGDHLGALPYLAEGLRIASKDPERLRAHRMRLLSTIARCPRLLHAWAGRGAAIWAAFSRDGRLALCLREDPTVGQSFVSIHDVATGELRCGPLFHPAPVPTAAFSPDGGLVLTSCFDGGIRIWDISTGSVTRRLQHDTRSTHAAFSPDGTLVLSTGPDGSARIWKTDRGSVEPVAVFAHDQGVERGAFSPDGRRIATVSGDRAFVWDLESRKRLTSIAHAHSEPIGSLCFSPDGKRLATGGLHREARIWDAATGLPATEAMVHGRGVTAVSFDPEGRRLITASWDRGRIWDARTGAPLTPPLEGQTDQVWAAFSPDGRYAVAASGYGRNVRFWDVAGGEPALVTIRHSRVPRSAAFHPDGHRFMTASDDGLIRLWDLARGDPPPIEGLSPAKGFDVSSDGGTLMVPWRAGVIGLFRASDGALVSRIDHEADVLRVLFRPGRPQLLIVDRDGRIVLRDLESGKRLFTLDAAVDAVPWADFSPAGDLLVTSDGRDSLTVRDAGTGEPRSAPIALGPAPAGLTFRRDGARLCAETRDGRLAILGLPEGKTIWSKETACGAVKTASFDGSGARLATGHGDGSAWIRDASTGDCLVQIGDPRHLDDGRGGKFPHSHAVIAVAFSSDDRLVLTASHDGGARVWSAASGDGVSGWLQHGSFRSAAFSPDGRWIATASTAGMGLLWDWRAGEIVAPPFRHDGEVLSIRCDATGARVFTAGTDERVKIFELPRDIGGDEDLILLAQVLSGQRIEDGAPRSLTPGEIEEGWRALRARIPEEFSTHPDEVLTWHRRELSLAGLQSNWTGVISHADRLLDGSASGLPVMEVTSFLRQRAEARAELGRWKDAAEDFDRVIEADPADYRPTYSGAILSLVLKDDAGYRRTCGRLLEMAESREFNRLGVMTLRACVLDPRGGPDPERAMRIATKRSGFEYLGLLGAALYRSGKMSLAILQLNKARLYYPEGQVKLIGGTSQDLLFLAMAYRDAGLESLATGALEKAEKMIAGELESGISADGDKLAWQDRLQREILLEEARGRLKK
jgi:WD40 repeat protein/predicted Ser/Thr protein kinase/tetratricopeptide (TPR) repeat protein